MTAGATLPGVPDAFWREAEAAPRRLLALDYDGTLAPFHEDRLQARMDAQARAALARLLAGGRTRLAIVSGRPLDELCALTEGLELHRVAEHGWDELPPGGPATQRPLPARAAWALSLADDEALVHGWTPHVERKRVSRALHTRGMEAGAAAELERRVGASWRALALKHGLAVRGMAAGLELRVPGVDKGTAVSELMAACPPGTVVAFIGDDVTDEDAFERVAPAGFAIRVGAAAAPSHANAVLDSIADVAAFLEHWDAVTAAGADAVR